MPLTERERALVQKKGEWVRERIVDKILPVLLSMNTGRQ